MALSLSGKMCPSKCHCGCDPVFRVTPFSIGEMIVKTKRCKIGVLLLLLLLPGCSRQPVEAQVYAMDTLMTIKLWGSHGETAVQDLSRLFQEQEAQLSVTRPGSLVDRLNGGRRWNCRSRSRTCSGKPWL